MPASRRGGPCASTTNAEDDSGVAFCGTASNPRAFASGSWAAAGAAASAATSPAVSAEPLIIQPKGYPTRCNSREIGHLWGGPGTHLRLTGARQRLV